MSNSREFRDKQLLASGPLKRYLSLGQTGIKLTDLPVSQRAADYLAHWRAKIGHALISKDRIRQEWRSTEGYRVDIDDALAGESECFRQVRRTAPAPIKIGINLSAAASSWQIQALRGGAVLAFVDLCKKQGRKYSIEACYGNGLSYTPCHVRVALEPYSSLVAAICASDATCQIFGNRLVDPLAHTINAYWRGVYRFYEFEAQGIHEYDFVLDRIETEDEAVEERRIMERLIKLGAVRD